MSVVVLSRPHSTANLILEICQLTDGLAVTLTRGKIPDFGTDGDRYCTLLICGCSMLLLTAVLISPRSVLSL